MRTLAAALGFIIVSRVIVRLIGVELDVGVVTGSHWQNLPLDHLAGGLWDTLLNLHSQPPLWNLVLGLMAKACGAEPDCVLWVGHGFNIGLTLAGAALIFVSLTLLGLRPRFAAIAAVVYTALPSVLFYEHYLFYPHFTSILFLAQSYFLLRAVLTGSAGAAALAFAFAAALCLTWSLFHPVYVLVVFAALWFALGRNVLRGPILGAAALAFALSAAPSVKNHALFGIAANGSWLGFNLSQVAPSLPQDVKESCEFETYLKAPLQPGEHPHPGVRLNSREILSISRRCASLATQNIIDDPASYVHARVTAALQSLSAPSHKYFFPPVNWERIDFAPHLGLLRDDGGLNPVAIVYRGALLVFYLLTFSFAAALMGWGDRGRRARIAVLLIPVVYFLAFAHAFNGSEQTRMRHTVEMSIWLLAFACAMQGRVLAGRLMAGLLARQRPASPSAAPS